MCTDGKKDSLPKLKSKCSVYSAYGFIDVFRQTDFQVSSYYKNSSKWVNARFHFVFHRKSHGIKEVFYQKGEKNHKIH